MVETSPVITMPPRRRWGRRFNVVLALLFMSLIAAPGIWGYRAQQRLDALLAEYRSRGEPTSLADLRGPVVPDELNAAIDLRAAAKLIDETKDFDAFDELALPLTDEEMRLISQFVERYRPAIDGVRRAAQKNAFDWQVQWQSPALNVLLPHLGEQKDLANLLRAAALGSHQEDREHEAVGYLQDMLFIGRSLEEHSGLVPQLVATGITMSAVSTLAVMTPTLSIADDAGGSSISRRQVQQLIAALLDDAALKRSSRRGLIDERMHTLDHADCIVQGRPVGAVGPSSSGNPPKWLSRYTLKGPFLDDAQIAMRHLTAISEGLEEPNWPAHAHRVPARPAELDRWPRIPLTAAIMANAHSKLAKRHYQMIAERRMAAVALAIRWWSLDHEDRLPASLDELVPAYLPAVPLDPLSATGSTILYKPDPDRPILYSVGFNGVDESGLVTRPDGHMWDQPDAVVHLKEQPRREPDSE